jgi:predicted PurR-regulated permease PerM
MQMNRTEFFKRTLIVVAVAVVPVLIWYLFDVILVAFSAIILAMLVRLGAQPFIRWASIPEPFALVLSGVLVLSVVGGAGYLFGSGIVNQFQDVVQRAASASADIKNQLHGSGFGEFLLKHLGGSDVSVTAVLSGFLKISTSFLEGLVIMLISAAYLAAQPRVYRYGIIALFPPRMHRRAAEFVESIGESLRLWLLGQLIEMLLIGTLSTFAVWIIGVPSPFALGLIAGIGEFIPYLGPLLAAVPAILVAITKSPEAALWTAVSPISLSINSKEILLHRLSSARWFSFHRPLCCSYCVHYLPFWYGCDHFCGSYRRRYLCCGQFALCTRHARRRNRIDK